MRQRSVALPNLFVVVRFVAAAQDSQLVLYGPERADAEARLKLRYPGIEIKSVAPYDFTSGWGRKAALRKAAVAQARAAGRKYDFDSNAIWGELKDFLFDIFDETCAYCESLLKGSSFGAVEHYRPKSSVSGETGHPGYYWLAYEVRNYLPTCNKCNTKKSTRFPLVPGSPRAYAEPAEEKEKPFLLNPYEDSPAEHLTFVADKGPEGSVGPVAKGISKRGEQSIGLVDLNRPDLLMDRYLEQNRATGDYVSQRAAGIRPIPVLEQLTAGRRPFSAAALVAVKSLEKGFPTLGG